MIEWPEDGAAPAGTRPPPAAAVPFGGPFTEAELWDAYDNDPRAHALVHFIITRRRWWTLRRMFQRGRR